MAHLQISQLIPAARFEVFDYLSDPGNLPFLLQPAIEVKVLPPDVPMKRGSEYHMMMSRLGFSQSVRLRVEDVLRGSRLTYRQVEGLFASWTHSMKFDEDGEQGTLVTDLVDYRIPFGLFGHLADDILVKSDLQRILRARLMKAKEHFTSA